MTDQTNRPPFETFKFATCRGCYALGTACGHCEKCDWEKSRLDHPSSTPPSSAPETSSRYFVFDVESVGLHGGPFAVGFVMLDAATGQITHSQRAWIERDLLPSLTQDRAWIDANVPPFDTSERCESPRALREWFWKNWMFAKSLGARMAADVPWPVEARFLSLCVADDPAGRAWDGPYPLIDIASVRLARGFDPLATEERRENELPAHDPLADARQSARLLLEALAASSTTGGV